LLLLLLLLLLFDTLSQLVAWHLTRFTS